MSIPDCTLVTACYDLTKYHEGCRNFNETLEKFTPLFSLPVYLVIYCSPHLATILQNKRNEHGLEKQTLIISKDFEELWISQFTHQVNENRKLYWPTKDERICAESHLICCSKFRFVLEIIGSNPFNTTFFGWIDGNIGKGTNNKICEEYSHSKILRILTHIKLNTFYLQRMGVVDKKYKNKEMKREYYNQYRWLVCGCLFLCDQTIGTKILHRLNEVFVETTTLGFGHGEEMLYLEILDEFYEHIHLSYGDYGQIVNNFLGVTRNLDYIFSHILRPLLNMGYNREAHDCSKSIIKQFENYEIEMQYDKYFEALFINYVSSFYYKKGKSKSKAEKIIKLCNNPFILKEFNKNPQFYNQQLSFSF